jgi:hypothetical protein
MAFEVNKPASAILTAKTDISVTTGVFTHPKKRSQEMRIKHPILISAGTKVSKLMEKNGLLFFRVIREGEPAGGILTHPSSDFMKEDLDPQTSKFIQDAAKTTAESKKSNITTFIIGGVVAGGIGFLAARNSKYKDKLWLIIAVCFMVGGYVLLQIMKKRNASKVGENIGDGKVVEKAGTSSDKKVEDKAESKDEMDKLMAELKAEHPDITYEDEHKFRTIYNNLKPSQKELAREIIGGTVKVAKDLIGKGEKDAAAYANALGQLEDAIKIKYGAAEFDNVMSKFEILDWKKKKS